MRLLRVRVSLSGQRLSGHAPRPEMAVPPRECTIYIPVSAKVICTPSDRDTCGLGNSCYSITGASCTLKVVVTNVIASGGVLQI